MELVVSLNLCSSITGIEGISQKFSLDVKVEGEENGYRFLVVDKTISFHQLLWIVGAQVLLIYLFFACSHAGHGVLTDCTTIGNPFVKKT